jgi:hypothetical protein
VIYGLAKGMPGKEAVLEKRVQSPSQRAHVVFLAGIVEGVLKENGIMFKRNYLSGADARGCAYPSTVAAVRVKMPGEPAGSSGMSSEYSHNLVYSIAIDPEGEVYFRGPMPNFKRPNTATAQMGIIIHEAFRKQGYEMFWNGRYGHVEQTRPPKAAGQAKQDAA